MDSFNMQKNTLTKTNPIQGIASIQDRKKQLLLIAQSKGIMIYNITAQKFQDEVKLLRNDNNISCIVVSDDLFFFAYGMHIAAAGANGKTIFDFDTYIAADRIDRIHVLGYRLWVFCEGLVNQFVMGGTQLANKMSRKGQPGMKTEDVRSHMFESKINDSLAVEDQFSKHYLILLKNNNQICIFEQKQLASLKTTSPPSCITPYPKTKKQRYLVGTMSGEILCIEANKKSVKELWSIKEGSKGRIYNIIEVKNQSFFVFRGEVMEIWGQDKTLLGSEETEQVVASSLYLFQKQVLYIGTKTGNLTALQDYSQMVKNHQQKSYQKQKQSLQKQVASLTQQLNTLKAKIPKQRPKILNNNQDGNAQISLSIDYQMLCTCLQISCSSNIVKIMVKGRITVVKCSRIKFEGTQSEENVYMIEEELGKNSKIYFKTEEKFYKDSKLKVMVYSQNEVKTYGVVKTIDLKPLSYHHKISEYPVINSHRLTIEGQFKYFEINMYLNQIFNDFGPATQSGDIVHVLYFESIFTKQKIKVSYKNGLCKLQAADPTILVIFKQFFEQKSRQKHMNITYSVQTSKQSIERLVYDLQKVVKPLEQLRAQYELLPGLLEIKNDDDLSEDLAKIVSQSAEITRKTKQSEFSYNILTTQLKQSYINYRKLNDKEVTPYQIDSLERQLKDYNSAKILSLILG